MPTNERSYHHGELRETLIRTSLELLAEVGMSDFSVAKVARRAGVSSGAPYRHFPDRDSLLAATGTAFLTELTSRLSAAVHAAGDDAVERLASTAGAYVLYAADYHIGFEWFAAMKGAHFAHFHEQSREMVDFVISLVQEAAPDASWSEIVELMEAHFALSQGFSYMHRQGAFSQKKLTKEQIAAQASTAARYLIAGRKQLL